nr:hypothetical protein [Tanacetum cinerariifolium]
MDHQYATVAKIPVFDTGKFEQWRFQIQHYLQHEHYAPWEVIEFGDSYEVPANTTNTTDTTTTTTTTISGETGIKSGRTVTLTAEDMQKKKNDVKARTTLLLSLPDEHQLRFSKYKITRELWAVILKTFGGNEATKKTKKNLLKQQYGNFRAEGSETLEQTFSRLQKKTEPNSQNMAFISSAKHNSGNEDGNTACVSTASTNVPTASASVATISQDTACAYIASQIKFEDINQFDEDDMEEMDIKWNMELLSMRADKAPRSQDRGKRDNFRQGSKAEEQAPKDLMAIDGVGWDWSYMANDGEDHAFVANEEAPIEFALMANTSTESKLALAQVESRLVEYKEREVKYIEKIKTLEFYSESNKKYIETLKKNLETLKQEKEGVDGKLVGLLIASKDLDNLIESQRSDKSKEGLRYTAIPPPPAQLYLSPKKDLSWTGLLECADDTVTDYSRPSPTVEITSGENQIRNPSVSKNVASPIIPYQVYEAKRQSI